MKRFARSIAATGLLLAILLLLAGIVGFRQAPADGHAEGQPFRLLGMIDRKIDDLTALSRVILREVQTDLDLTTPPGEPPRYDCYCDPQDPQDPGSCTCDGVIDCAGMILANVCDGSVDCDSAGCGCTWTSCN